ncbi:MAG: hypothetical protein ASARMPRED_001763 [Alectoria sarmentosa]|nr:MAG: hypothetical protein ASARMPRED_001763 [Alectoria sarmentosa]
MSSVTSSDLPNTNSQVSKGKKHKKKKGSKAKLNGDLGKVNGAITDIELEHDDADGEEQEPKTPTESPSSPQKADIDPGHLITNGTSKKSNNFPDMSAEVKSQEDRGAQEEPPTSKDISSGDKDTAPRAADTDTRLEALVNERAALRKEVAQVRRSLEEIQEKHEEELGNIREQLADTQGEKEQAETQYRNLLGKVNTIKSQLGERLKADAEDLSQARSRIEDLEEQCGNLREQNEARATELATIAEEGEQKSKELSSLRNRTTISQQNWSKERDDLLKREAYGKEEFEAAKQAMQDWEVLAMEERTIRETIAERVTDLEEQVASHREAHERAASERDSQLLTVDGLQRALQEIQDARRRELRELVEASQAQVEKLQKQLQEVEGRAADATNSLELMKQELERALPFEKEVKEKNLLIGKLRHEAVILNDHLTKALRYLKKGKPEDTIDKQLVTNHFLHFLALERADPKKFQVLQIIASLLAWTDEQREQAGLARPGASNPNLRVPLSPWHRTPSTPALSTDFFPEGGARKESLAELWSDFLEQEAQEGIKSPRSPSSLGGSKPP